VAILTESYEHLERPQLLSLNHGKRVLRLLLRVLVVRGLMPSPEGYSDGEFSLPRAKLSPDASLFTVVTR
jgi:hypothetical protein